MVSRKSEFMLGDYCYLNCAYMGPLSRQTEIAGLEGLQRKLNPINLLPEHFFAHCDRIRESFARLINERHANSISVIPAVSYGMATVAKNTKFNRGQNIVLLSAEMPSNYYIWYRVAQECGLELRVVPRPMRLKTRGVEWNAAILDAIDDNTALASIPAVHWLDGTGFDLKKLSQKTHAVGGAFIVDGTQSLGAQPYDNKQIAADAIICAGYKWLLGPYSLAVAHFGERYSTGVPLEENWLPRERSEKFSELTTYVDRYRSGSSRFDVGEASNFILSPMLANALSQILDWGPDQIATHCSMLTNGIEEKCRDLGFDCLPAPQRAGHYLGLKIPKNVNLFDLHETFRSKRIAVSVRADFIRVTPHCYNEPRDMEKLIEALEAVTAAKV